MSSSVWAQPSHHSCSGTSPAAVAKAQRGDDRGAVLVGHVGDDTGQVGTAAGGDLFDEAAAGGGEGQPYRAPVAGGAVAAGEALADEPVAHAGAGGGVDAQFGGDVDHALRAAGGQHDQGPVLGQGHLGVEVCQRAGGQPDHGPAGRQQRVDQVIAAGRDVRGCRGRVHGAIIAGCRVRYRGAAGQERPPVSPRLP